MARFFDLEDKEIRHAYVEESFIADVQFEISKVMKRKGISRAELARRLDVSAPHVTQMLGNGDSNLTLRTVARIFAALEDAATISSLSSQGREVKSSNSGRRSGAHSSWSSVACANDAWNSDETEIGDYPQSSEDSVVWLDALRRVA